MNETEQLQQRIQQLEKELKELRQNVSFCSFSSQRNLIAMRGYIRTLRDHGHEEIFRSELNQEFYDVIEMLIGRLSNHIIEMCESSSIEEQS